MKHGKDVWVVYRRTPAGMDTVRFAARVARLGQVHVLFPVRELGIDAIAALMRPLDGLIIGTGQDGWREEWARFAHVGDPATFDFGRDAVVVDPVLRRADVSMLRPSCEYRFLLRGGNAALVPLGNRNSTWDVIERGIPLAKELGVRRVVLYHTTWRRPNVASDDPRDHMDDQARAMLARANGVATILGLDPSEVVESVPKVAEGIAAAAARTDVGIIVMGRDRDRFGHSYSDEVAELSACPTLTLNALEG